MPPAPSRARSGGGFPSVPWPRRLGTLPRAGNLRGSTRATRPRVARALRVRRVVSSHWHRAWHAARRLVVRGHMRPGGLWYSRCGLTATSCNSCIDHAKDRCLVVRRGDTRRHVVCGTCHVPRACRHAPWHRCRAVAMDLRRSPLMLFCLSASTLEPFGRKLRKGARLEGPRR